MRILLDTHVWIWTQEDPDRLGSKTVERLTSVENQLFVSPVSSLVIARLVAGGRIALKVSIDSWIDETMQALDARTIEVSHQIATDAYALPGAFHKDLADRLLVATARVHALTLFTADERILGYPEVERWDMRS